MQHCQAFQSCCICTHSWTPGLSRGCDCDGYRRFLAMTSRGRMRKVRYNGNVYEFSELERRKPPTYRDVKLARQCLAVGTKSQPFLGHKHAPLVGNWPGYAWRRVNVPEWAHGSLHNIII